MILFPSRATLPTVTYSAVQIYLDSDEMRQIFVKIRFNLKSHKNYLINDTFNTKYDHPLPLRAFSRFDIESTNVEHNLTTSSSWYQVLILAEISFCAVEQLVFAILRLIIARRFSIRLR